MKVRSRSFLDGRQHAPVAVTQHLRSWAAGVMDACGAVRVVRGQNMRWASWTYEVGGVDLDTLEELRTILGAGTVARRNRRLVLVLNARGAYEVARTMLPLMRGRGRDHLRLIASWATTLGLRGFGRRLDDGVVDLRGQLYEELLRIRKGGRLDGSQDALTSERGGITGLDEQPGDYDARDYEDDGQDIHQQHVQHGDAGHDERAGCREEPESERDPR